MKKYVCLICGYVHEGDEPPAVCPVCGAAADKSRKWAPPLPLRLPLRPRPLLRIVYGLMSIVWGLPKAWIRK